MPNDGCKNPFLMIRLTYQEAKVINEIREKFHISGRQIFEIIQNCGCQEGDIEGYVKASRINIGGQKALYHRQKKSSHPAQNSLP